MFALALATFLADLVTTNVAMRKGGHEFLRPNARFWRLALYMSVSMVFLALMAAVVGPEQSDNVWLAAVIVHGACAAWNIIQIWRAS